MACHDPLTGLANRSPFNEHLRMAIAPGQSATTARRASSSSTRPVQVDQRHPSATTSVTTCCSKGGGPPAALPACAPPGHWPGSAATNSWCSQTASAIPTTARRWPSGWRPGQTCRGSPGSACASTHPSASPSPDDGETVEAADEERRHGAVCQGAGKNRFDFFPITSMSEKASIRRELESAPRRSPRQGLRTCTGPTQVRCPAWATSAGSKPPSTLGTGRPRLRAADLFIPHRRGERPHRTNWGAR